MITPEEVLNDIAQDVIQIKMQIIPEIDDFIRVRARQLKDLQIIQYEIDYQMDLNADKEFIKKYSQLKEYVIKELIDDYNSSGWMVTEEITNSKTILNFATEKIMKHIESCKTGYAL